MLSQMQIIFVRPFMAMIMLALDTQQENMMKVVKWNIKCKKTEAVMKRSATTCLCILGVQ